MLYCFSSPCSLFIHLFFNLSWEFTITAFILWSNLWVCWTWIKGIPFTFSKSWFLRGRGLGYTWVCECIQGQGSVTLPHTWFCTSTFECWPDILFPMPSCRSPVPDACYFAGWDPFQVWVLTKQVMSTHSMFSGRSKSMFVSLVSRKGKNPPVLPSEKFFWSDCSQNESGVDFFSFFQFVCLIYFVPLRETKLGVERIYSGGKKKRSCFSSSCQSEAKIGLFIFLVFSDNTW